MKIDNLVMLESMFLPEYRDRLPIMLDLLMEGKMSVCKALILKQSQDLKANQGKDVDVDHESFAKLLLDSRKSLLNRIKAFKLGEMIDVEEETE